VVYEEGPTYRYLNVRAPGGSLICREKYEQNGQSLKLTESHTYHEDGLGSTLAMTDQDGDVTDKYSYDAWGNATHGTGTTADNPYQYVGQLGYYTHYQDSAFRFLQLGVRFYDPEIGRFTQRDRIESAGHASYDYARGRPLVKGDPSGRFPTFSLGPSCRQIKDWPALWEKIQQLFSWMETNGGEAGDALRGCEATIPTQCWVGHCDREKGLCGQSDENTGAIKVSLEGSGCPPPECIFVHEAVHICGLRYHNRFEWGDEVHPTCGKLWEVPDKEIRK